MRKDTYNVFSDRVESRLEFTDWRKQTYMDDVRRFNALRQVAAGKSVLDFGCGNGAFLSMLVPYASEIMGVELDEDACSHLIAENIPVADDIDKVGMYDVITMWMVIEHLSDAVFWCRKIKEHLNEGGIFYVETVNANDALISLYDCDAFKDFTFWSEHLCVYNNEALEKVLQEAGFTIKASKSIQRYPLSNHLYWLSQGRPGGHVRWEWMNDEFLVDAYERLLASKNMCDSIWIECKA